ncbi:DnaJ domain-containing protein [Oscillatoria sp. FACHB-1407]|uniref:J domain-containing protein n=1 Tax=Oscillatoria sp. FACHB-1407 TaxID=2692847 RepID=UPI001686D2EE|nr:J domain-containing protein [Oscillatoria sp. FACHB-1407]MBD2461666.1 DnaJ domain-containing protein [Oscillatoria sp. FACHB-1407]
MSQITFSPDWLRKFTEDPYAVLGASVSADGSRVLKRYRSVAKLLHPDRFTTDSEVATQIFARLVNPAYQKLKQENDRKDVIAMLRFRVRRMSRDEIPLPKGDVARQLLKTPLQSVDIIYEQAVSHLAELQYQQLERFEQITDELGELNLIYLRVKMGEPLIREKRSGIIPVEEARPIEFDLRQSNNGVTAPPVNYAERHYQRAQEYMKKSNWSLAVQELRDALRIQSDRSEFHALLAKAYLMQNLPGMATVHFKQALKLNPKDPLALEYAQKLKIDLKQSTNGSNGSNSSNGKRGESKASRFFGLFAKKR